jgi:tetratricopeptide (TPR) repeat protein
MRFFAALAAFSCAGLAQTPPVSGPQAAGAAAVERQLETGHCKEALPLAKRAYAGAVDKDLKRRLGAGAVRCAMTLNQVNAAAEFVALLNRDFPQDPDILYLTVHTYSDLSLRASQSLLFAHPDAYQVHQLNAEALETQGKWDEAAEEYRVVLQKNPNLPGLHYRLGRVILSKAETPATRQEAKKEFEEELRIDPSNAGAEFVLAELARQADNLPEAVERFTRASKLDVMFADAYIGLGRSLLAMERAGEAVTALEQAAKLQPANPTIHYLLANAYRRAGRPADAARETQAHKETSEKARETTDELKKAVSSTTGKSQ